MKGKFPGVWRTSSLSGPPTASDPCCVRVAGCDCECDSRTIFVIDSKDPDSPMLSFGSGAWRRFVTGVASGIFDS